MAIDDFGTGYSALSYLHRFPIHTIKINQSFIREIPKDDGHIPVVLGIISIARGLGPKIVTEGVGSATQVTYLENDGCTTMQGYYYYRPLPRQQFLERLGENLFVAKDTHFMESISWPRLT